VDDIALPPGALRMRGKGSDGGHNGLISITETLGTSEYPRLRFGIGNDFAQGYQVEYVLGKWTVEEEKLLLPRVKLAAEMVLSFGINGVDRTMSQYNSR
jgi:peptidyl-tRNA hydrolase, PTH1 family